jgi:fructokinase
MPISSWSPVLSIGELLWDVLPAGPRLGGTTTNFAILTARLGDPAALVTCLGRDHFGSQALSELEAVAHLAGPNGFDLSGLQWTSELPTGTVDVKMDAEGRPHYTISEPVAWDAIAMSDELLGLANRSSVICYGTLAQREKQSRESIRNAVQATSQSCVRVCDVNLRMPFCTAETLEWCVHHATILKISEEELPEVGRLLGLPLTPPAAVTDMEEADQSAWLHSAARSLMHYSPACKMIAITLGPHGSYLMDRCGEERHGGFPITVADTIGAGDAFTAGMVHAYTRGATLRQINSVSNLCGSYVAGQPGATPEVPATMLARIQAALAGESD